LYSAITAEGPSEAQRRELRLLSVAFTFLVLAALAMAIPRATSGEAASLQLGHLVFLPIWAGCAWMMRRFADRGNSRRDPLLLPIVLLLAGWGVLIVWRIAPELGARQIGWFLVGSVALIELMRSPPGLGWLRRYRYVWLTAGIAVTALTLVLGTNPAGGEQRLWLGCCGLYFQPSEPLRLLLIAFAASYLADRRLANPRAAWAGDFLPLLAAGGLAGLLLLAQRDLGAGLLLLALLAGQIYVAYGRAAILYGALGLLGAGAGIGVLKLEVVRTRFEAWINPWLDPTGAGYQIVQSLIAIASGGLLGSGPGRGAPTAVPVVQSDFVFAAVAEEWGLVGALAMIALFAVLVGRGLRVAAGARDPFAVLLAVGVSLALGLQTLLILGGTLRLLPITGVTLPFVSYGGTSFVTSSIAAGFLVLLSSERHPGLGAFGRPILRAQAVLSAGWIALALALGWWVIVRGEALTTRTDNPRRSLASRYSLRGSIFDWEGVELAASMGTIGSFARVYYDPASAPVTGYDSSLYGQAGIETSMDGFLRGEIGPDPLSIWWSELVYGTPPPGLHLRLTLNSELQRYAAEGLAASRGAVVVVDARSGSILAMASSPSFDPSTLDQVWPELVVRTDGPLLNRATQGRYQPGMTLAPLLFAWGISNGLIEAEGPAPDFGGLVTVFDRDLGCERPIDPQREPTWATALSLACPGPFAALGEAMGSEELLRALKAFGLLDPPLIRLEVAPAAGTGLTGDPGLAAIGQADLTVTPLQLARAFSVLTGAGVRPALTLVAAVGPTPGDWQPLPPLDDAQPVLPPSEAQRTLDNLTDHGAGLKGYEVQAASGSGSLAWFIGFGAGDELTVVLLEGASPGAARELGLAVLRLAADLDLTSREG